MIGWPWTIETPRLPDTMPDGKPWPRISIVTPSYNQGQFIEETIRSILLQGYPDYELIIQDGCSVDNTLDVIHKYERWVTRWTSKKDGGQVYAINEGFNLITGEIANWINSDDVLLPGALQKITTAFDGGPVVGSVLKGYSLLAAEEEAFPSISAEKILRKCAIPQQAIWMPAQQIGEIGPISEKYNYAFDVEYLVRIFSAAPPPTFTDCPLVFFRLHEESKTVSRSSLFTLEIRCILLEWAQHGTDDQLRHAARVSYRRVRHRTLVSRIARTSRWSAGRKIRLLSHSAVRYRRIDRFFLGGLRRQALKL